MHNAGMCYYRVCSVQICLSLEGFYSHCLLTLLVLAVKKAPVCGTGGGPPVPKFTPADELALDLNQVTPVLEGIRGVSH